MGAKMEGCTRPTFKYRLNREKTQDTVTFLHSLSFFFRYIFLLSIPPFFLSSFPPFFFLSFPFLAHVRTNTHNEITGSPEGRVRRRPEQVHINKQVIYNYPPVELFDAKLI